MSSSNMKILMLSSIIVVFLTYSYKKTLLSYIDRYSPTEFKIDLNKLEVVFKADNFDVNFKISLISIVKLTSKQQSKLTRLSASEPNLTELGTAQPPLVFSIFFQIDTKVAVCIR